MSTPIVRGADVHVGDSVTISFTGVVVAARRYASIDYIVIQVTSPAEATGQPMLVSMNEPALITVAEKN